MIQVKLFQVNPLMVNNYVVSDNTKEACLIDCGCMNENEWNNIKTYINDNGLELVHMLCTHLHFDHIMGCGNVFRDFGLEPEGDISDITQYNQRDLYIDAFGLSHIGIPPTPKIKDISCLTSIRFGVHKFTILKTPGHTPGGICFYCAEENIAFVGDTLFQASIGRTDLPGGDTEQLIRSIKNQLLTLPPTTHIFTGHGPTTTIDYERKFNPYI